MSTISSSTTNPYLISYSASDIIGADSTLAGSVATSTTSTSGTTTSGTYSSGLVSAMSGFDVGSMVSEMMTSDYTKLNQLLATQQKDQWTEDRYRSETTNLNNFSDSYFDATSSNYVLSSNSFAAYTATPSNATLATSTALNTATAGNYTIYGTKATAASISNASATALSGKLTNSSAFSTINGGTASGTLALTVNGTAVSYAYTSSSTIGDVMSALSSQSGDKFSYSELTKTFTAASTTTGSASTITLAATTGSGSDTTDFLTNAFANKASVAGIDGTFTITEPNGVATAITESSNNFTIDGLNYNVTSDIPQTSAVTINVASNISGVVSKIQGFVTAYNNLTTGLNTTLNETTDYDYKPLTYAQEAKMTTAQVTAWNTKVQQGELSGDDELTSLQSEMRTAFSDSIKGSGLTMASLGLSTSDDYTQGGTLTLDTTKLTAALQKNPNAVINVLTQTSTSYPYKLQSSLTTAQYQTKYSEEGIFQRLNDIVTKYAGTATDASGNRGLLLNKAGLSTDITDTSTLGKTLKTEATSVTDYKTQITNDKTKYTTQYTALQTALSNLSTQQSYVTSMLSSSSSS